MSQLSSENGHWKSLKRKKETKEQNKMRFAKQVQGFYVIDGKHK